MASNLIPINLDEELMERVDIMDYMDDVDKNHDEQVKGSSNIDVKISGGICQKSQNPEFSQENSNLYAVHGKSFLLESVSDVSAKFTLIDSGLGIGVRSAQDDLELVEERIEPKKKQDPHFLPEPEEQNAIYIVPHCTPSTLAAVANTADHGPEERRATDTSFPLHSHLANSTQTTRHMMKLKSQTPSGITDIVGVVPSDPVESLQPGGNTLQGAHCEGERPNINTVTLSGHAGSSVPLPQLKSSNSSSVPVYRALDSYCQSSTNLTKPIANIIQASIGNMDLKDRNTDIQYNSLQSPNNFEEWMSQHSNDAVKGRVLLPTTIALEKDKEMGDVLSMTFSNTITHQKFAPNIILPEVENDLDFHAIEIEVKTNKQKYPTDVDVNELYLVTPLLLSEKFFDQCRYRMKELRPEVQESPSYAVSHKTVMVGNLNVRPHLGNCRDSNNGVSMMEFEDEKSSLNPQLTFADPIEQVEVDENNTLTADSREQLCQMITELEKMRYLLLCRPKYTDKNAYRCYFCKFVSTEIKNVIHHWRHVHMQEKPYLCSSCLAAFTTSSQAYCHILCNHPEKFKFPVSLRRSCEFQNPLELCITHDSLPLEFPSISVKDPLPRPMKDMGGTQYECLKCPYTTTRSGYMKDHVRKSHMMRPYTCGHCKRGFLSRFQAKRHLSYMHPGKVMAIWYQNPEAVWDNRRNSTYNKPAVVIDEMDSMYRVVQRASENKEVASNLWKVVRNKSSTHLISYHCRTCSFVTGSSDMIWHHVRKKHALPAGIRCTICNYYNRLSNEERMQCWAICRECNSSIALKTTSILNNVPGRSIGLNNTSKLFTCNNCSYDTRERSGMIRHIKYQHLRCRPYNCPYCAYSSVERPKVRIHIRVNHPRMAIHVTKNQEEIDRVRGIVRDMYEELDSSATSEALCNKPLKILNQVSEDLDNSTLEDGSVPINSQAEHEGKPVTQCAQVADGTVMNKKSYKSIAGDATSSKRFESSTPKGSPQMRTQGDEFVSKLKRRNHYMCRLCKYRCLDRSCMNRHVKYRHLKARPHQCPYCHFDNVEKTKVRMHVMTSHPGYKCFVDTDDNYMQVLINETRKYYVRVLSTGKLVDSITGETLPGQVVDEVEGPEPIPQMLVINLHSSVTEKVINGHPSAVQVKQEPQDDGYENVPCSVNDAHDVVIEEEPSSSFTRLAVPMDLLIKTEQDQEHPENLCCNGAEVSHDSDRPNCESQHPTETDPLINNLNNKQDCMNWKHDPKLKLKATVVLQDIVHVILSGCGTW